MTYILSKEMFNSKRAALIASLLMAVSAGHVFISRAAYATPGAVFFVTVAAYLYAKSRRSDIDTRPIFWLILAAMSYGVAFSIHPSIYYTLPVVIILELQRVGIVFRDYRKALSLFRNLFIFFSAFIMTVLIWEIPHFASYLYFLAKGAIPPSINYFTALRDINNIYSYLFQVLSYIYTYRIPLSFEPRGLAYFPSFVIASEGWPYMILLICALLYLITKAIKSRFTDYRHIMLPLWILGVYLLYSIFEVHPVYEKGTKEIRVFMQIYPAMAIAISVFFTDLLKRPIKFVFKAALIVLFIFLVLISASRALSLISSQANLVPMNDYLKTHPEIDKVIMNINNCGFSSFEKVMEGLDGFRIVDWDRHADGKYEVLKGSGRLAVLYRDRDALKKNPIIIRDHSWAVWNDNVRELYENGRARYLISSIFDMGWIKPGTFKKGPVFSYPGPFTCRIRLYDIGLPLNKMEFFRKDPYFSRIGIYDLSDAFE